MLTRPDQWSPIILEVCQTLEKAEIRYHADASSSLYVHGFAFNMDDFDVTVEWGKIDQALALFEHCNPSPISGTNPRQFTFRLYGCLVDIMSYESKTGIGPDDERTQVMFAGYRVWSKVPAFYLSRMRKDHPIRAQAHQFFTDE
ncbi:hypothetical protein [Reinekea sp. G2M2-21]|uniref:hypothetical protein n=1 Tax=Reinekea sp. G2M2-21 TaxID=2788942 RepID=UPI0018A88A89|nr:hypothetical protein [Reinekea sp. G2M2-21]